MDQSHQPKPRAIPLTLFLDLSFTHCYSSPTQKLLVPLLAPNSIDQLQKRPGPGLTRPGKGSGLLNAKSPTERRCSSRPSQGLDRAPSNTDKYDVRSLLGPLLPRSYSHTYSTFLSPPISGPSPSETPSRLSNSGSLPLPVLQQADRKRGPG